ncbi:hypothetical protein KC19_11G077200 [Ceratodon purpureus]|uniref:Ufm1-specific protease n=1 Tax=Ceratodon purpureus TaxID=3225 RepID=A0A8T0GF39_CERPU|nr:hypothetical protein KC19_N038600 [Ceratodon purpureus]KAG0556756.1 hypothetical protein KC19_11G077200 [Ceratodon purpureus]KAG0556757.1 hypothetical protein KC19_11G077200 [Ceratodon purpureus]KAG0556758.1 hypothetical protein KC19_11G077200 [Ceratodon purpureus]KAG0556759.1 hypothetical protein KC19_11G077200 [Ceratodon purpureus]
MVMEAATRWVRVVRGAENGLQGIDSIGWLVGLPHSTPIVLSVLRCLHGSASQADLVAEAEELRVLLPRGLKVLGAVDFGEGEGGALRAGRVAVKLREELQVAGGGKGCIVAAPLGTSSGSKLEYRWYDAGNELSLVALDVEEIEGSPWDETTFLRCQLQLSMPLYLQQTATASEYQEQAVGVINKIVEDLKSSEACFLAEGPKGTILLPVERSANADSESPLCSSLRSVQTLSTPGGYQIPTPVKLSAMSCSSKEKNTSFIMQNLPARTPVAVQILKLNVDVLCAAPNHMSGVDAVTYLVIPALCDQLNSMTKMAKKNASQNPKISAFHFCPLRHPITAIYDLSYGETEMALVNSRKSLHQRLRLPLDRPLLRVANALMAKESTSTSTGSRRLCDVHVGLPPSGVVGGTQSLIDGSYEYYHYLQDRFDDNGWGCAYRSLQTIISWFRLQHYTSVPVPSHREIQETLVEIGDKEASFIDSQEWIGSMDLCYVIDKLLGVSCKVLDVRSGADLPGKCRELALHFRTQGTPIMIGGGVLAYTLLGIDYNEMTGESAFLILDPHYTGGEDLKSIWSGGWCGWKRAVGANGKEFFLANRFYNLLMPQRPNTV